MMKRRRKRKTKTIIIVLDGVGAGSAPDSSEYGDLSPNTLGHVLERAAGSGGFAGLPVLESLGLGNIAPLTGIKAVHNPLASYGLMRELGAGKDTITGHWEMMGILNTAPFPTFPEGFPADIILEFEEITGRKILGNRAASGTLIIEELGPEHMKTGSPIVYTSADSVFQIAAHIGVIGLKELYSICERARRMLSGPGKNVCRVIARPFEGTPGSFRRIPSKRKDFPFPPPGETVVDRLAAEGVPVFSVGKVAEMFDMRGFSAGTVKTSSNRQGMEEIAKKLVKTEGQGLIFANLNDFDTLYGHRNDPEGFARALAEFDGLLGELLPLIGAEDCLFITADHGNDPTTGGTDHSRELVPLLFMGGEKTGRHLGVRHGFMDLGATVAQIFGVQCPSGKSFLF